LVAASEFVNRLSQLPQQINDSAVATVGKINVHPNGVNDIPGEVNLYVDIRDIYEETRDKLIDQVIDLSEEIAQKNSVQVKHEEKTRLMLKPISKANQRLLLESFESMGLQPYYLPSGSGHDAMSIELAIPISMIFVRSKGVISHNPAEWADL